jgi:thiaminase (transcriptional activator TenA)
MLSEELREVAEPVLRQVIDHPFWSGMRDGSLPGVALVHFVEQDTGHLLPWFGRAFASCAAVAADDAHAQLLGQCAFATIESAPRLRAALTELAPALGVSPPAARTPAGPTTSAYCSYVRSAAETSLPAGLGAVLPFMWFHLDVCEDLASRLVRGSRYAPWLEVYHPGEGVWHAVRAFLGMVDGLAEQWSDAERAVLIEHFCFAGRYEWAFAEAGWCQQGWPC